MCHYHFVSIFLCVWMCLSFSLWIYCLWVSPSIVYVWTRVSLSLFTLCLGNSSVFSECVLFSLSLFLFAYLASSLSLSFRLCVCVCIYIYLTIFSVFCVCIYLSVTSFFSLQFSEHSQNLLYILEYRIRFYDQFFTRKLGCYTIHRSFLLKMLKIIHFQRSVAQYTGKLFLEGVNIHAKKLCDHTIIQLAYTHFFYGTYLWIIINNWWSHKSTE